MQSHRVVPAFDKGEADDLRLGLRGKAATFQQLAFEGREEALAHRIVVGVADRSHRRPHTGFPATFAECQRRILGGINWSSQHNREECCDGRETAVGSSSVRRMGAKVAAPSSWSPLTVMPG